MINAGSCKKEAGMREDTTSTSATSVAPIASSALALALAAGEHSEGSETASGASADLCVDSGKRYHMRQVSPQLEQGISSRMGAAESIINVNSTAARRVCEQSSGEWRKATREHEAGTHQHRTRCPGKMDVFHGCYDVGGPARAGDVARDHGVQIEPKTAARHEGPVAKMHVGLDDVRNASREVARRRDHDTVTDMDGAFACHVAQLRQHRSVPDSTLPTSAATPPEVRQESARDTTVLTHIRKAHSAYDKFQRDAKSVVAKPMECSTTQGCTVERDLKTALVKGEKLDQELMSLETLALKGDPLSDDDVLIRILVVAARSAGVRERCGTADP